MSSLNLLLSGTILPWLLGLLLVLGFAALLMSIKLWRDTKRSPYFFMRQQAAKRMQSYLTVFTVMILLSVGIGVYGWRTPEDATVRMAILTRAKPAIKEIQELMDQPTVSERATADAPQVTTRSGGVANVLLNADDAIALNPQLPAAYDQVEPLVDLNPGTELGTVVLSSTVTDEYKAINPVNVFGEGFYTLYATFDYKEMADGMAWAWVWRYNGQVIDGGNELWAYGDEGPGYIYLSPEEGFGEGRYTLEVWVNGELLGQASATMNDAAVSAGN
ncbi:MAG: hypothetical protein KA586_00630 [Candidatus Promineofilum sp.]|nr:hypothetical protein [Promineifilum sp.]